MGCRKCLTETSAHGWKHVVDSKSVLKRILWFILTILALSLFIFHSIQLAIHLKLRPTSTTLLLDAVNFPQPDIYICFNRALSNSYLRHPPEKEKQRMNEMAKDINNIAKVMRNNNITVNNLRYLLGNVNITKFYENFGLRMEETILSALCNEKKIIPKLTNHKYHLACLVIKPSDCDLSETLDSLEFEFYIHNQPRHEYDNENEIKIDYNSKRINNFIDMPYGYYWKEITDDIKIYFEHINSSMDPSLTMVSISPRTHTIIQLTAKIYKSVNRPNDKCTSNDEKIHFVNYFNANHPIIGNNYSYFLSNKFQYVFKKYCKCIYPDLLIPTGLNASYCYNIENGIPNCVFRKNGNLRKYIRRIHEKVKYDPICDSIEYNIKVTDSIWPTSSILTNMFDNLEGNTPGIEESKNYLNGNNTDIDLITGNLYKITIQTREKKSNKLVEEIRYTWINFCSDVGGIMGFYLGASVLTLCELTKVLFGCIKCKARCHKRKKKQKNNSDEFDETQNSVNCV